MSIVVLITFPRSGGTIFSKCLACLPETVLLSEVHPLGCAAGSVAEQARDWYDVEISHSEYLEEVRELHRHCTNNGKTLIIRDYTFMDFVPNSHNKQNPSNTLSNYRLLKQQFPVKPVVLVRDPIDIWISRWKPPKFFVAYDQFVDQVIEEKLPVIHFEDFSKDPESTLMKTCSLVGLKFSLDYKNYVDYHQVTGDNQLTQSSRGSKQVEIKPLPRQQLSRAEIEWLEGDERLNLVCRKLGYSGQYHDRTIHRRYPQLWVDLKYWLDRLRGVTPKTEF